jgi:hypothetical protein
MTGKPDEAMNIAFGHLEDLARWLGSSTSQASALDTDAVRDALAKRVHALTVILPENLMSHALTAITHYEHEALQRTYVLKETMYGDLVADIPRSRFLVTEDGVY